MYMFIFAPHGVDLGMGDGFGLPCLVSGQRFIWPEHQILSRRPSIPFDN